MKDTDIFEKVKNIEREIRELCDKRYRDGVSDGFDDGYNQGYFDAKGTKDDEIREQGRKDAWECARKMVLSDEDGGIALSDILKIFGMTQYSAMKRFSASEAIAKIKEYEENQKRTCDTCQYLHGGFNSIKKCANCYGNSGWTPKQTEQRCKSKMTIDEAITHCEEVADSKCDECGAEHRQLAEWLKELKRLREQTRWIPVSERPPETDDEVIAYDGADAFVAWYGVNGWHSTDNRFGPRVPIIEWKPINLPKAEEKTNDSCWKEYYESKFMKKV